MAEQNQDSNLRQATNLLAREYPKLTQMQLRDLALQIVRLLQRDLANERDRFGR